MNMTEAEIYEYQQKQQVALVWEQLQVLKPYLENESLTDIMVNQNGRIFLDGNDIGMRGTDKYIDEPTRIAIADILAGYNQKVITEKQPILSGKLPSGERVEIVTGEACGFHPTISIRKPNNRVFSMDEYCEMGGMSVRYKRYLEEAVKAQKNIVIFGGTGTGKTTCINTLITTLYGTSERIIVVEEVPELIIDEIKIENLVRYNTTPNVSSLMILKSLMRQRPDRIIYGELRFGNEVETLLDGWNTGHKGGITSNHANSALDGLHRIEELLTEVPGKTQPRPYMVTRGIDVAVHIKRERTPEGKYKRFINEILELKGYHNVSKEYDYTEVM